MSNRLPEGWDPQDLPPASVAIADEELAGHLRRRAVRPVPRTLVRSIMARVDDTAPERRWRLAVTAWRPRIAVTAGGLVLVLLASLLYVGASAPRNGGLPTSSPPTATNPATAPADVTWDPTERLLTPAELLRVMGTSPAPGTVLIVDDQIVPYLVSCAAADHCPSGELRSAPGILVEAPPGGHLPYAIDPTISTTSIMGPLALEVGSGPNLVFLGRVVTDGPRTAFAPRELAARSATGGLFVVPGWLWKTLPVPCPTSPTTPPPAPTSELGLPAPAHGICAGGSYLTDAAPTPPIAGPPSDGVLVQEDAYARFAKGGTGIASRGVYLVRDWAGYGEILVGLQPIGIPAEQGIGPTPEPTPGQTVGPSPAAPGGIVRSVDDLVAHVLDGTLAPGSIAVVSVPAGAVRDRWPSGVVHSCPQLCPMWILEAAGRSLPVAVSEQAPIPASILGAQAFLVLDGGSVRALGPAATGQTGEPLDGGAVVPIPDGLTVVHGWLRTGPPLLCPQRPAPLETGLLGEPLSWSQCPGMWILPSDTDPWNGPSAPASNGSGGAGIGDLSVPDGTLHVHDRAANGGLDPREGVWLVRAAVSNACPPWARCPGPADTTHPQPGVTWFELVGPVVPPDAAPPAPASPLAGVLDEAGLVAAVTSGSYPAGSLLIADAKLAPVLSPFAGPEPDAVVGAIGGIPLHLAAGPNAGRREAQPMVVRVRDDGGLDDLGPVTLDDGDRSFASSALPDAADFVLVHGWFYRPTFELRCLEPQTAGAAQAFEAFDGQVQSLACDPAWILPSKEDPVTVMGSDRLLDIPDGALAVQIRDGPQGVPTEGLYLVRHIFCLWHAGLDVCEMPGRDTWELVGRVAVPGT